MGDRGVFQNNFILLFYRDAERDSFVSYDRYAKRVVRPLYNLIRRGPSVSGFYVAYANLVRALRTQGYQIEVNNHQLARRNPEHPIGVLGYPEILDRWDLPNPAVLGPGLYDHPRIRPDLMTDPRFKHYIVHSRWMKEMFAPIYGPSVVEWHAGIDTSEWPDTRNHPKSVDVLIYDKTRAHEPPILDSVLETVRQRRLTVEVLRYGTYRKRRYQDLLSRSRSLIFLSAHETQGLAYQEAMASNVPVLAWDQGFWLDTRRSLYEPEPVPATSVPFFSYECGERFRGAEEFGAALDEFLARLPDYEPRRYVERELSLASSARCYMQYYGPLMKGSSRQQSPAPAVVS